MASTTSGLTATVSYPPPALRTSPPPVIFLRPISRCSGLHSVRAKGGGAVWRRGGVVGRTGKVYADLNHEDCSEATKKDQGEKKPAKAQSLVCSACEGNGAISCTQCKGGGENLEDHFGGRFKAGGLCWLCRGKREILCGSCNGAGFLGGFMSTADGTSE